MELECILGQKLPALYWQYEMLRKSRGSPVLPELRVDYRFELSARSDDAEDYLSKCEESANGITGFPLPGYRMLRHRTAVSALKSLSEHVKNRWLESRGRAKRTRGELPSQRARWR